MSCPTLIGELGGYFGQAGPHMLPDHSEVFFGTGLYAWAPGGGNGTVGDIHRFSYPGLVLIEQWTPDFEIGSMCMGDDGTVYYCEIEDGKIYRRSSATAAGSDSIITWTLPDTSTVSNLGTVSYWVLAWNPGTRKIIAVAHNSGFSPLVWVCDPVTEEAEVNVVFDQVWTGAFPPTVVCTGDGAIWMAFAGELSRIRPDLSEYDGPLTLAYGYDNLAVTHDNRVIVQSGDDEFSTVDSTMTATVLACPDVYADPYTGPYVFLTYGTQDPNGAAFSLMYVNDASDKVWKWPAGGRWWLGVAGWSG